MLILPKHEWPKTALAQHYLLFAQQIRLLLSPNAFESFRAPVLDNPTRLTEFIRTSNKILYRELAPHTIVTVRDELVEYLRSDRVSRGIIGDNFDQFVDELNSLNPSEFTSVSRARNSVQLRSRQIDRFYEARLRNDLRQALANPNRKIELLSLTRAYITSLLNQGYDRRFLIQKADTVFFNRPIARVGPHLFDEFCGAFDGVKKSFVIYIPIRAKSVASVRNLPIDENILLPVERLPKKLRKLVEDSADISANDQFLRQSSEELDQFRAADSSSAFIQTVASATVLEDRSFQVAKRRYAFARPKNGGQYSIIYDSESSVQPTAKTINPRVGRSIGENLKSIVDLFANDRSAGRMLVALKGVSLARDSKTPENQITLIWSAIETLFGDPPRGSARLKYYRECLHHAIQVNYCWRYSKAVFRQVEFHNRRALQSALRKADIDSGIHDHRRFQLFIFDPQHKEHHRKFLSELSHHPIMLHLVFGFYRRFGTPQALRRNFKDHGQRVSWQLDRIYRARNDFVHSGITDRFVDRLAVNAFEYFRTALHALLHHASTQAKEFEGTAPFSIEEMRDSLRLFHAMRQQEIDAASLENPESVTKYLDVFRRF